MTQEEYDAAIGRIMWLMVKEPYPGSTEYKELMDLVDKVEAYERRTQE